VIVTMIAGASSSSSARSSAPLGQPTGAPFFSASRSFSWRFSFFVLIASFRYHVTVAPNGGF